MPTPPYVPRIQLGQHNTSFVLTGMTVAADGALTAGTAYNVLAQKRGFSLRTSTERSEINGSNTTRQNEVVISNGRSASLDIFLVNNTADPNPLETAIETYDYFKLVWAVGTATGSIETYTGYFVRGDLDTSMQGRGEHIATMDFGPCDPGITQVARVLS